MTKMSAHEKKPRPPRQSSSNPSSSHHAHTHTHKPLNPSSPSSSIATPPRVALRFKPADTQLQSQSDGASIKSTETNTETDDTLSIFSTQELSLSSLLTGKDGRIAELENEVRVMTDEFEKELTGLSLKLTAESEVATFWREKHGELLLMGGKYDAEIRALRQEIGSSLTSLNGNGNGNGNGGASASASADKQERAREERERDIKTRITSLVLDRDAFREAYNEAMGEIRLKDELVQELRGQVRGLKAWVSVSGKTTEQVADEEFGDRWRMLGNGLQNWVITGFRKVKIDLSQASPSTTDHLTHLIPTYTALASSSKIHLIQALVSRLLLDHVFSAYFVGLTPEHASILQQTEKYLATFGTPSSLNAHRSTTLSILHKSALPSLLPQTTTLISTILTLLTSLLTSISSPPLVPDPARDASFRVLLNSAIDLSRLLRVQKARFEPLFPVVEEHTRTVFRGSEMEDMGGGEDWGGEGGEGEGGGGGREVLGVVWPGLIKWGDEIGEGGMRNVVARVRVLCAPDYGDLCR